MSDLFIGTRGVIIGVASEFSIAWQIARSLFDAGAEIAFACQGEAQIERCQQILGKYGQPESPVWGCDMGSDDDIDRLFQEVKKKWGKIDFVVHAVAFTDREELRGPYVETTRKNFEQTLSVSTYSFTRVVYHARKLMVEGGSLLTLTYVGANKVVHGYNLMGIAKAALEASIRYLAFDVGKAGIRVNGLSAGPVKTIAGRGVANSRFIYRWQGEHSILKRNIDMTDIGGAAQYLLSDLSSGVTGEIHYVDTGYHSVGMVSGPSEKASGETG